MPDSQAKTARSRNPFRVPPAATAIASRKPAAAARRDAPTPFRRLRIAAALAAFCILATPGPRAAADVAPALADAGWEEITFDGYVENRWIDVPGGVRVISDGGISIVFRPLAANLDETPILAWKWRSDNAPAPTDLSRDSGEDRALSLYVAFPHEPERATFRESLQYSMLRLARGSDAPGRILDFVWGGMRPQGTLLKRSGTGALRILRTPDAPVDTWLEERVDIVAEFREAFGWDPPDPTHIGITSDSDDTGRAIDAMVVDIRYVSR